VKRLAVFVLASSVAVAGFGKISINFNTASETFYTDSSYTTPVDYDNLFLAFWSSDSDTSGYNVSDPTNPTGGDKLLGAYQMNTANTVDGYVFFPVFPTEYDGNNYGLGTDGLVGGYAYIAFFDMAYSTYSGSVPQGTAYGLAPSTLLGPLADADPATGSPPQPDQMFTGSEKYHLVPEPASAMLGVFGVGVILYRRWRSRR
jgi:hypothetical protein